METGRTARERKGAKDAGLWASPLVVWGRIGVAEDGRDGGGRRGMGRKKRDGNW